MPCDFTGNIQSRGTIQRALLEAPRCTSKIMLLDHLKVRMLIKPLLAPNSTSVSKRSPTMQMRDLLVAQMDDRPHHRPWGHTHEECATRSGHVSQSNFILSEAEHYRGEGGASEINAIIFSSFERD